jgi:hypothetical protein
MLAFAASNSNALNKENDMIEWVKALWLKWFGCNRMG